MIIWICTDMEGLAGINHWDQCYHPDDNAPEYLYGREQLTAEVNAAVAGCFDAGATEVRQRIRHDIARAIRRANQADAWRVW